MSVLRRIPSKAVAAPLFRKNSEKRVTILRGLAAGLVASVPLVLSTELLRAANGQTDLTSIGFRVSNVLITPSIHTETKNLFSVAG